jgi:hypothetical protein
MKADLWLLCIDICLMGTFPKFICKFGKAEQQAHGDQQDFVSTMSANGSDSDGGCGALHNMKRNQNCIPASLLPIDDGNRLIRDVLMDSISTGKSDSNQPMPKLSNTVEWKWNAFKVTIDCW